MPKQRITKEMVLDAAFGLLREGGEEQVLVKNIAAVLGCSVQPIYSYCENMDSLRMELSERSGAVLRGYVGGRLDPENLFESTGKAYINFSKEEPNLFKSYFLRKRTDINSLEELYAAEASGNMAAHLAKTLGISESGARKLHLNMIVYNTGLSFLLLSTGGKLPLGELHATLESAYKVFLAAEKTKNNGGAR